MYGEADGVISSFFLWKVNSWKPDYYWNELDFEKVGLGWNGEGRLKLNLINGYPGPNNNDNDVDTSGQRICKSFHDYGYEWTPDYVAWFMDGREIRRTTGGIIQEFNQAVDPGMQFRFNIWPGNPSFGGNFNPGSLPLYQYIDWVRYSSYSGPGNFTFEWQEDFDGDSLPADWSLGNWGSPLDRSTHRPENVIFTGGMAVLALTPESQIPTNDTIPPPPTPAPPTPGGSGCCNFGGSCNCGDDNTGWCNGSPSNCAVCGGGSTWDPNGNRPSCGTPTPAPTTPAPTTPAPTTPAPPPPPTPGSCSDQNQNCPAWAASGECENNPAYMLVNCRQSCGVCSSPTTPSPPPPPTPQPTPAPAPLPPSTTPAPTPGCCRFAQGCDCGDDGTGWCNGSPSNCAACGGGSTWDPNGAAPSCGGGPSPPSPSPTPPTSGGQCCFGGGCSGCNGPDEYCSGSASVCSQCGGTYCSR